MRRAGWALLCVLVTSACDPGPTDLTLNATGLVFAVIALLVADRLTTDVDVRDLRAPGPLRWQVVLRALSLAAAAGAGYLFGNVVAYTGHVLRGGDVVYLLVAALVTVSVGALVAVSVLLNTLSDRVATGRSVLAPTLGLLALPALGLLSRLGLGLAPSVLLLGLVSLVAVSRARQRP